MRRGLVVALGTAAICLFTIPTTAVWSEPIRPPLAKPAHVSKARFSPSMRHGKSAVRPGVITDQAKTPDPRYQQMWDPCQVEG
jgi:hypothetical protein